MLIRELPADERPRERLLAHGSGCLSEAELLALCLRTGARGLSALELARGLLADCGGLAQLLGASSETLLASAGLGPAKVCQLKAALELARRALAAELEQRVALTDPRRTADYLRAALVGRPYEVFACLFLDQRHRVLRFEELFRGTIDGAAVYPREVVKRALALNAAALICAHNHPSGVADPSSADVALTARLREALALVEVRLLDHFVIGAGVCVSLAERGLL
jgi:DNA repair protein RadC